MNILETENNSKVIIDYAHTPKALESIINSINQIRTKNCLLYTSDAADE